MRFPRFLPFLLLTLLLIAIHPANAATEPTVLAWNLRLDPSETILSAVAKEHSVVVSTTRGLTAFSVDSGKTLWRHDYPDGAYALGLPEFSEDEAVFMVYRGREKLPAGEKGDAQLTALNLKDGSVLWSVYVPDFLPIGMRIIDGRLYLSALHIAKPLTLKQVDALWMTPYAEREGTWLICLDPRNGMKVWHARTDNWSLPVGTVDGNVYFADYRPMGDEYRTSLIRRNPNTGGIHWTFSGGPDKTDYVDVVPHPRGIVAFSRGWNGTISQLLHPDTGELKGSLPIAAGARTFTPDTLWTVGLYENMFYDRVEELQAVSWDGFFSLGVKKLNLPETPAGDPWFLADSTQRRLERDVAFWSVIEPHLRKHQQTPFRLKREGGERLLLPDEKAEVDSSSVLFEGNDFFLAEKTASGAQWAGFERAMIGDPFWSHRARSLQWPVWMRGRYRNHLVAGYDGALLEIDPSTGEGEKTAPRRDVCTLSLSASRDGVLVVLSDGLEFYHPKPPEPVVEPEAVLEVQPAPEPRELTQAPPKVILPPFPYPLTAVPPAPVVHKPVQRPLHKAKGWRVQIMFLAHTPRPKVNASAKEFGNKLHMTVHVEDLGGGRFRLVAGDFPIRSEARIARKRIRSQGFPDAYVVRTTILVPAAR